MKLRVLLDCDGILSNFAEACIAHLNEITGSMYVESDLRKWDLFESLGLKHLEDEVIGRMKQPGACLGLSPYQGSKKGVKQLREIADVYIVTAPLDGPNWEWERRQWLSKHYGIPYNHVISTLAKHTVAGDVLIEDKTENLRKWFAHVPTGMPILWAHPTNQDDTHGFEVARSWDDVVKYVKTFGELFSPHARMWTHV